VGQCRQALPAADGMRIVAIHPRSGIQPSAYSLTFVQMRNVALPRSAYRCGGTGAHVFPFIKVFSGADGEGGLRRVGARGARRMESSAESSLPAVVGARRRPVSFLVGSSLCICHDPLTKQQHSCGARPRILACCPCMVTSQPSRPPHS